ncbi:MAG: ROK family protein, partial [Marmoricola sp.]
MSLDVRRRNTAVVLRLLRDEGPLSRTDLAHRSGLAKATVGTIVGQLQQSGAVAEGTSSSSGLGRPSTPLVLDGVGLAGIGLEVNVDYVATTVLDLAGRELSFEERSVPDSAPRPGDVVDLIREEADRLAGDGVQLLGVTVAVPGLIDRARGRVVEAPNLGWSDEPLGDAVRHALGGEVPVAVDNDANCAARAESVQGVAAGVDDFVYLTGTVGLGAGIVSGGRVLRGARGLAGEVGHMRVGDDTEQCACGRTGCWEALVGLRALVRATGTEVEPGEDPVAYAERLAASSSLHPGLRDVAEALGRGVAQLAATVDPRMV